MSELIMKLIWLIVGLILMTIVDMFKAIEYGIIKIKEISERDDA